MNSGIYALYWWDQDLVYIGLSQNLDKRRKEHFSLLTKVKHTNYKIQEAYNKFGYPDFIIIEYCNIVELPEREIFWCKEFDGLGKNGLCLVEPGVVGFGTNSNSSKYSKIKILKIFSLLYKTRLQHKEIATRVGVPASIVHDIKKGASHLWLQSEYPTEYAKMCVPISSFSDSRKAQLREEATDIISPDGVVHSVINIREFAKINNLHNTCLGEVIRGARKSHKGWRKLS
jgi:hypothetical protein